MRLGRTAANLLFALGFNEIKRRPARVVVRAARHATVGAPDRVTAVDRARTEGACPTRDSVPRDERRMAVTGGDEERDKLRSNDEALRCNVDVRRRKKAVIREIHVTRERTAKKLFFHSYCPIISIITMACKKPINSCVKNIEAFFSCIYMIRSLI